MSRSDRGCVACGTQFPAWSGKGDPRGSRESIEDGFGGKSDKFLLEARYKLARKASLRAQVESELSMARNKIEAIIKKLDIRHCLFLQDVISFDTQRGRNTFQDKGRRATSATC